MLKRTISFRCFFWLTTTYFWLWNKKHFSSTHSSLTLKAPIATKVVWFSRLLKCLRGLYGKQCGPRSDCSLFWVHTVCFYTLFVSKVRQLFAADYFSRRHFQMHFFLGALRAKLYFAFFWSITDNYGKECYVFIFVVRGGGKGGESMRSFGSVLTELIAWWVGPVKKILFA